MKYIVNKSHNPAFNIALEAYAFRELVEEDELFILWINEPAIIIGKHQNTIQEINKEYIDEHVLHVHHISIISFHINDITLFV